MKRETILVVDDEDGVLNALEQQLNLRFGHECEVACAKSGEEALRFLGQLQSEEESVAIVIADQVMPGMKGVKLLEEFFKQSPETASILLTGQAGLDAVVTGINRANLNHYIPKPWDEVALRLAVEGLLKTHRLTSKNKQLVKDLSAKNKELVILNTELEEKVTARTKELAALNVQLETLAITDGLTELYNYRHFQANLEKECERSLRTGSAFSLLMLDVDHFKNYNDLNGHPAGDSVLKELGRLLLDKKRVNDFAARYGGEEFVIVLVDTPKKIAKEVAERLRIKIEKHKFSLEETQPGGNLTISMGLASFPNDAKSAVDLVKAADKALYQAKDAGRNRVAVYGGSVCIAS